MQPQRSVRRIEICYPFRLVAPEESHRFSERFSKMSMNPEMEAGVATCGNCRSPMPAGLRFCRNCGFRLGEGSAEYTETVRFQNAPPGTFPGSGPTNAFPPYAAPGGPIAGVSGRQMKKRRRRMSGMTWMFLGLLIFFVAAG